MNPKSFTFFLNPGQEFPKPGQTFPDALWLVERHGFGNSWPGLGNSSTGWAGNSCPTLKKANSLNKERGQEFPFAGSK